MLNSLGVNFPEKRLYIQEKLQLHIKIKINNRIFFLARENQKRIRWIYLREVEMFGWNEWWNINVSIDEYTVHSCLKKVKFWFFFYVTVGIKAFEPEISLKYF